MARSSRRTTRRTTRRAATPEQQLTSAFNRLVKERPMVAAIALVVLALVAWLIVRAQADDDGGPVGATSVATSTTAGATATKTSPGSSPSATAKPTKPSTSTKPAPTTTPKTDPAVDPVSGLPVAALSSLPVEAAETVELIFDGGPFPYGKDGAVFGNFEGLLPDRPSGYYREYTVPTPGESDRGARRIVAGDAGELYYTADHYDSFVLIEVDT